MKKFFCFGKDDFCYDTSKCFICDFCNCSGGEEREAIDTNADHIRSMTDEELAASNLIPCPYMKGEYGECKYGWHDREQSCEECMLDWLKQPYKEET